MRIPDRFSVRAAMLAMCGALLGACGSARAPSGYRPQLEELDRHLFGAWVIIETGRGSAVRVYEGELLAVGATHVTVLDSTGARGIAIVGMSLAELEVHESSGAAMAGWTVAGAVSTLSHGWVLLLTAPMWIIGGTISTAATANAGYHYQHNPDAAWWRTMTIYARYPQGLPSGLDVTTLRPWKAASR